MAKAILSSSSMELSSASTTTSSIFGTQLRLLEMEQTQFKILNHFKKFILFKISDFPATFKIHIKRNNPAIRLKASREPPGLTQEITDNKLKTVGISETNYDLFSEMKHRFLTFKKEKYLENLDHYQNLANAQAPKFMVIACADSRVCPSSILGFQPGEAFIVRNVANLVPPYENGPSETNAALEFAVNSLEVENILVVGHSRCGGIHALMSMQDDVNSSSFIRSWVVVGKSARLRTKAAASNLSFEQQCKHCEKESINRSLLNLLSYPWIQERVTKGTLTIHGGYYDFVDCTFEKWTLECNGSDSKVHQGYTIGNREFWC